jgi:hypothetical protein
VKGCCKCGNELSGSIKRWEALELLHNLWPLEHAPFTNPNCVCCHTAYTWQYYLWLQACGAHCSLSN